MARETRPFLIHPDGRSELIEPQYKHWKFEELQALVEGPIEVIYRVPPKLGKGVIAIVNEEGAIRDMRPNVTAALALGRHIFGPVVLIPRRLFK